MQRRPRKSFFPLLMFFVISNMFFITGRNMLARWGVDQNVLILGNVALFAITLISFLVTKRGLTNSNPHAFIRGVYSGIMLKLFLCIIAAGIYISIYRSGINKGAFFTLMGLYLVYTFIEISSLTKLLKEKKVNG